MRKLGEVGWGAHERASTGSCVTVHILVVLCPDPPKLKPALKYIVSINPHAELGGRRSTGTSSASHQPLGSPTHPHLSGNTSPCPMGT